MATAQYLSAFECELLLRELNPGRDRLLFVIGCQTGYRISELLSLKWRQIWTDGRPRAYVEIPRRQLKGGRSRNRRAVFSRRVALNETVATAISTYVETAFPGKEPPLGAHVFQSREGDDSPLSRRQALWLLASAAHRAGIQKRVGCHSMRRTFCINLMDLTGDVSLVQRCVGHANLSTTAVYISRAQIEADQAVQQLGKIQAVTAPSFQFTASRRAMSDREGDRIFRA